MSSSIIFLIQIMYKKYVLKKPWRHSRTTFSSFGSESNLLIWGECFFFNFFLFCPKHEISPSDSSSCMLKCKQTDIEQTIIREREQLPFRKQVLLELNYVIKKKFKCKLFKININ